ncbi:MAG: DNA-3-methyladenine glycosylase [Bacteroidia bacterium]
MEDELMPISFLQSDDVVGIARDLLGCRIQTTFDHQLTEAFITETEAYKGISDMASHAFGGRRTMRTEVMYKSGGHIYVYLCYGIHHLFNIVTGPENTPHAVLIRGIEPLLGIEIMEMRRKKHYSKGGFSSGPATASQALGIKTKHTGIALNQHSIKLLKPKVNDFAIEVSTRIGVEYAKEDALLPYRFNLVLKNHP